jgi:hypothetical protein
MAASLCRMCDDADCTSSGAQIPGTRSLGLLNFTLWPLTSTDPECLTCFTSLRVPRILRWLLDCWEIFSLATKALWNPAQQRSVTPQNTRIFRNSAVRTHTSHKTTNSNNLVTVSNILEEMWKEGVMANIRHSVTCCRVKNTRNRLHGLSIRSQVIKHF